MTIYPIILGTLIVIVLIIALAALMLWIDGESHDEHENTDDTRG